ncbi:MAG: hypothetical protein OHK0018_06370 [Erythrobacter tepidarius]
MSSAACFMKASIKDRNPTPHRAAANGRSEWQRANLIPARIKQRAEKWEPVFGSRAMRADAEAHD